METISPNKLKVAIIGGGISGLSATYQLLKNAKSSGKKVMVDLYEEKPVLGGNADTVYVKLGEVVKPISSDDQVDDSETAATPYVRWADLGVNDLNLEAYDNLIQLMLDVGYIKYEKGCGRDPVVDETTLKKLSNTACFYDAVNNIFTTDDEEFIGGISDSRTNLSSKLNRHKKQISIVIKRLAIDEVKKYNKEVIKSNIRKIIDKGFNRSETKSDEIILKLFNDFPKEKIDIIDSLESIRILSKTCGTFFQECIDEKHKVRDKLVELFPNENIAEISDSELVEDIIWARDSYYYPRISAMYFTDPKGPAQMPLVSPFCYYALQESSKGKKSSDAPDRRYFVNGSMRWINYLAEYLLKESENNPELFEFNLHTTTKAKVTIKKDKAVVEESGGFFSNVFPLHRREYDACVIATHADDAIKILRFDLSPLSEAKNVLQSHGDRIVNSILNLVTYTKSYSVCHTSASIMPPNTNSWRSYNIPTRNKNDSVFPYRMNYVVNLHQNDMANKELTGTVSSPALEPTYFVSLVDDINKIPASDILDREQPTQGLSLGSYQSNLIESTEISSEKFKGLNKAQISAFTGYKHLLGDTHEHLEHKAWTLFKHNVLNLDCLKAQSMLDIYHEYNLKVDQKLPLYFSGGWTNGAGLHEECIIQSYYVADLILPPSDKQRSSTYHEAVAAV